MTPATPDNTDALDAMDGLPSPPDVAVDILEVAVATEGRPAEEVTMEARLLSVPTDAAANETAADDGRPAPKKARNDS